MGEMIGAGEQKLTVAVTGGSGFLAAHLLRWLQSHRSDVAEIRTIDRKPFREIIPLAAGAKLSHHRLDLMDAPALEKALQGVHLVFHLARKGLELVRPNDRVGMDERYTRDNLDATESLLDAMFQCSVGRLVHVGDAYANLPPGDNFGTSEDIHCGLPGKYLLGQYGESRAKAEMAGRDRCGKALADGSQFHALFLRPVLVYGEGDRNLPLALRSVGRRQGGQIHALAGASNGMHQYIYAGHLAALMADSMDLLLSDRAAQFSGEYFYCMDGTECTKMGQFLTPFLLALGLQMGPSKSTWTSLARLTLSEWLDWANGETEAENSPTDWSSSAFQFLFRYAIGFSNRKMNLILRYRPEEEMEKSVKRTADWIKHEMGAKEAKEEGGTKQRAMG